MNAATKLEHPDNSHETEAAILPLAVLRVIPNGNPRRRFHEAGMEELERSIAAQGVVQAITVFPHPEEPGAYGIIAGERRYRAAINVGLSAIPAVIRFVTLAEARVLALIENTVREDMSVAEEAHAARDILSACNGDRDEASRMLGWSRTKLDARLLLLHAAPEVLDALTERTIKLGHAELLCGIPTDAQGKILQQIVESPKPITVEMLRTKIESIARVLASAPFDTAGCAACPHNSAQQATLFDTHVSDGKCQNPGCWNQKVSEYLASVQASLREDFAVVVLEKEASPSTYTSILKTGQQGVGAEQFSACRACVNFGCVISDQPGNEGKKVAEDCCFDLACHAKKVAEYQKSLHEPNDHDNTGHGADTTTSGSGLTRASAAKPAAKKAAAPKENAGQPTAVTEAVNRAYATACGPVVSRSRKMALVYAVIALAKQSRDGRLQVAGTEVSGSEHSRVKEIEALYATGEDALFEAIHAFAASIAEKNPGVTDSDSYLKASKTTFRLLGGEIADTFMLTRDLLDKMTKGGIEAALSDPAVAFAAWYNEREGDDKAFKKLVGGKKGELLDTVFKTDFDWTGKVPAFVRQQGIVK